MTRRRIAPFLTTLFAPLLLMSGQAAATNHATFKQNILPLNCVFQEVNDGLGTLIYLTPKECGVIIPPPSSGGSSGGPTPTDTSSGTTYQPISQSTGSTPSPSQPANQLPGGSSYNLDLVPAFRQAGYVTNVKVGQVYYFVINDTSTGMMLVRIAISRVSPSSVDFTITGVGPVHINRGNSKSIDANADNQADVSLTVLSGGSQSASVRFKRLINSHFIVPESRNIHNNTIVLIAAILGAIAMTVLVYTGNRRLQSGDRYAPPK